MESNGKKEKKVVIRKDPKVLSLLFMGDFCPLGRIEEISRKGDTKGVLEDYKLDLENKDLSIANLECPLTTAEKGIVKDGPSIKADPVAVKMAKACGFDVLSLGNNHIMDFGREGLLETIKVLEEHNLSHLGAGQSVREAEKPLILEKNGLSVAFLSFCETEFNIGSETEAGCAPIELHGICEAIREAKEKADLVVPLLHCGSEHYPLPSPRIKQQCRLFADCGASAIICHHTHTAEGFEVYRDVPIFYGLGNFIFGYVRKRRRSHLHWNEGLMTRIDMDKNGAVQLSIIPYFFDAEETVLKRMEGPRFNAFLSRLELLSGIIGDDEKLERLWRQYSLRRYKNWYTPALKKARLYFWRNKERRDMILWHNRMNESHNDVITTALNALRKEKNKENPEIKAILDELIGRETTITKIKRLLRAWI